MGKPRLMVLEAVYQGVVVSNEGFELGLQPHDLPLLLGRRLVPVNVLAELLHNLSQQLELIFGN
jgi:hypothetical protein